MAGLYDEDFVAGLRTGAERLAPGWGLSPATRVRLLTLSENATFRADDPARAAPLVLRVHRPGYHDRDEIASELAWIEALRAERIVETPRPVPAADGLIAGFDHAGQTRHVVAFEHMTGAEPDPAQDLTAGFRALGAISARLHDHARRWTPPPGFRRKTWTWDTMLGDRPLWGDWRAALGLDDAGRALLERCSAALAASLADWGTGPDRFGLVHADLRLANLLVEGDRLGVIDFDDCGFSWFLYDFAAAISFIETDPAIPALTGAWVAGYREVAPLSEEEVAMLPVFVMLRRMLLTAWIASHAETPTAREAGLPYTAGTLDMARQFLAGR